jgi:hypothetical protein
MVLVFEGYGILKSTKREFRAFEQITISRVVV